MKPYPDQCPICSAEMEITRLYCPHCDTTIEGHFQSAVTPFSRLTSEQIQYILAFVRCEGRFNRLEDELGMSYPTLRNRLVEIIRALGYEPGKEEAPPRLTTDERRMILEDLDAGKITLAQAQLFLSGKRNPDPSEPGG